VSHAFTAAAEHSGVVQYPSELEGRLTLEDRRGVSEVTFVRADQAFKALMPPLIALLTARQG